jgi:hypothetical protein
MGRLEAMRCALDALLVCSNDLQFVRQIAASLGWSEFDILTALELPKESVPDLSEMAGNIFAGHLKRAVEKVSQQ